MPLRVSVRQRRDLDQTHRHALSQCVKDAISTRPIDTHYGWVSDRATLNRGRTSAELLPRHRGPRGVRTGGDTSACGPTVAVAHDRGARAAARRGLVPPGRPWRGAHRHRNPARRTSPTGDAGPRGSRDAVQATEGLRRGRVDLVTMPSPGIAPLTTMMVRFADRFPGMSLHIDGVFTPGDVVTVYAAAPPRSVCSVPPGTRTRQTSRSCTWSEQPLILISPPGDDLVDTPTVRRASCKGNGWSSPRPAA